MMLKYPWNTFDGYASILNIHLYIYLRYSGGTLKELQSSKINSSLQSQSSDLTSALAIKDAVFNAWNAVKSESAKEESLSVIPEVKGKAVSLFLLMNIIFLYFVII